jgi:hypothetical protein
VEREVPGRVPGVLPLVGHGDDVLVVEVPPRVVAALPAGGRWRRLGGIALQPPPDVEVVELLAPQQSGKGLAHHPPRVVGARRSLEALVELVGLTDAGRERGVEGRAERVLAGRHVGQAQGHGRRLTGGQAQAIVGSGLGAGPGRVDGIQPAVDDIVVERVLDVHRCARHAPQSLLVRIVLGEEQLGGPLDAQPPPAERRVLGLDRLPSRLRRVLPGARARCPDVPRPRVAEPQRRQQAERSRLGAPIGHRDADQDVVAAGLRVLDGDVEVAVLVEDPGVEQLVLGLSAVATRVFGSQRLVRERRLRVLVQPLHVGVRRRGVEVEVVLLHVLAVIAVGAGHTEQPLLEDRVTLVPERDGEAEPGVVVADTGQAVLAPPVGARARVIVGEVLPGGSVGAVVLPDRAPLTLAQVGPPPPPVNAPPQGLPEPALLLPLPHDDPPSASWQGPVG